MTTGCQNNEYIEFGIIADVQYADKDSLACRHYRDAIERLTDCVSVFNRRKPAFVIQLGDIIDGSENAHRDLDDVLGVYNKLQAQKYHVLGNHDFWGPDRQLVLRKLGMKKAYYDFTVSGWRFVVLDTMDIAVNGGWGKDSENYLKGREMLERLKQQNAPNAADWNGGIGPVQKKWLRKVLQDAGTAGQNVLVFGHVPLIPPGDRHNLWNSEQIVEILESFDCVKAYFCGHRHTGGYADRNGICHLTIESIVESPVKNAFAVVKLHADRIVIQGQGKVPCRTMQVSRRRSAINLSEAL